MGIFNKKENKQALEEKRLEEKITREMRYKSFQKEMDKTIKESEAKMKQYRELALKAKAAGNKTQMTQAVKYMKFVQYNIDRAHSLKMQLDMAFMNTNFSTMMKGFVDSLSDFADGMKMEGTSAAEMAKNFSRFSVESQKFSSQVERFDSFIEDTESLFDDLMPSVESMSDSELEKELGLISKGDSSENITKIDELLKDLKG